MADSNAPVQEKALDALIAFLRAADADAGRLLISSLLIQVLATVLPPDCLWSYFSILL